MTALSPCPAPRQGFPPVTLSGVPSRLTRTVQGHLAFIGTAFERSALLAALDSCLVPY